MPSPYRSMQNNFISQTVRVRLSPENWMRVKTLADMGGIFDNISIHAPHAGSDKAPRPLARRTEH